MYKKQFMIFLILLSMISLFPIINVFMRMKNVNIEISNEITTDYITPHAFVLPLMMDNKIKGYSNLKI